MLRRCGMVLPNTFYVDNIFIYHPCPYVKSMYYMNPGSVPATSSAGQIRASMKSVMVKRVDQQLRVTRHMIDCQDLDQLQNTPRLRSYMLHYLSMMMAVSDIFLLLDGSPEAL